MTIYILPLSPYYFLIGYACKTILHCDRNLEDRLALERAQKNAFNNILQDKYEMYQKALIDLNIDLICKKREVDFNIKKEMFKSTPN